MDNDDLDSLLDIAVSCVGSICPESTKLDASRLIAMVVIEKRRRTEMNELENDLY
jgi:hypothetical protein